MDPPPHFCCCWKAGQSAGDESNTLCCCTERAKRALGHGDLDGVHRCFKKVGSEGELGGGVLTKAVSYRLHLLVPYQKIKHVHVPSDQSLFQAQSYLVQGAW